jgi:hypothetical protein
MILSAGKAVNPWNSFGFFHEQKLEGKSRCHAFEPARFARR